MACDTFAVPASGAGVEREFSISGRVITKQRNRLNPSTIRDLMQFKRWSARHEGTLLDMTDRMDVLDDLDVDEEVLMDDEEEENDSEVIEWLKAWERKEKWEQRVKWLARK
jgi:hypothetical protein